MLIVPWYYCWYSMAIILFAQPLACITMNNSTTGSISSNVTTEHHISNITITRDLRIRVGLDAIVLKRDPSVLALSKKLFTFIHMHPFMSLDMLGKWFG